MDLVRYKPGEAIRWLQTGAEKNRKDAKSMTRSLVIPEDSRALGENLKSAAGALMAASKGALADILHQQAEASEFVLSSEALEAIRSTSTKTLRYRDIKSISTSGDRYIVRTEKSSLTIKPYAFVVAGRLKVPVGWLRNGIEVPFELLIDELAARCGLDVD